MRKTAVLTALILILGNIGTKTAQAAGQARKIRVLKTAYCLRGHTASGRYVHPGTVAVDPRIIRMGSRMYIPGYGRGIAEDTGSAIKGYHIDVWMSSCSAAMRSTRYVTITVY
jgi:3D (Asp-Asp-Asp) domain-containing protein